ncbi:hypothetical protein [Aeromicrobium wangtongii]|uniref:Uncharacterized protein n=1 Tax=Aeromicrobium wangtongii TaxID=2969247 RepID=A0ABY5M5W1_9ACTN|nr:hypothetical protein [Aeromicrobium wangtongii]MCD9198293.1 hypothetical protein [Aeromicrobium wangtongii]UUP12325.1 hypothetical protein NQV15_10710 [Aeromicrobium wangtongii]
MTPSYSKIMSAATAGYAAFALVKPRHLGAALTNNPVKQQRYDLVARLFGPRDLAVSTLALLAPSAAAREQAMWARVALDLADAVLLTPEGRAKGAKAKVLGATLSWASLNVAAILADRKAR